jgi:hypothetical protein
MHGISHILLGLTALERWGATRRLEPRVQPYHWFVLIGAAVIVVLLVLLMAISSRRRLNKGRTVETFTDNAQRRGLSARERQILLAVAMRSGLSHTYEIFHEMEAFQRGTIQLLGECTQTRTPEEIEALKAEIARLRLKLGFRKAAGGGPMAPQERLSTRQIPVGASIDLTRRWGRQTVAAHATVLGNDGTALAVMLHAPLESAAGDPWFAQCYAGMSAWEFRTSTVRCDGTRLVLAHSDEIRFINRRRFPRVAVHFPGLIAHLPLMHGVVQAGETMSADSAGSAPAEAGLMATEAPVFVESTITELAGPGLRIETALQVHVDDRVLVVFLATEGSDGAAARCKTVAAVGRVRQGRDTESGTQIPDAIDRVWTGSPQHDLGARADQPLSIAVELTGLSDEEIEELASLTSELAASRPGQEATKPAETSASVAATT